MLVAVGDFYQRLLSALSFFPAVDLRPTSPRSHVRPSAGAKGQRGNILGFMGIFGHFYLLFIYLTTL